MKKRNDEEMNAFEQHLGNLSGLREDIDEIDRSLIALLESRLELCRTIAEVKQEAGLKLKQAEREDEVIAQLQAQSQDALLKSKLAPLYRQISQLCLEAQAEHLKNLGAQLDQNLQAEVHDILNGLAVQPKAPQTKSLNTFDTQRSNTSQVELQPEHASFNLQKSGFLKSKFGRIRWRKEALINTPRSAPLSADQRKWLTEKGFAHRGLHDALKHIPENSLPSFEAAIRAGFGIELDVHLSTDGVPMVFHDEELGRMTGIEGEISDYSSAELKQMTLIPGDSFIPTLAESLALINGQVPVLIEVKNYGQAVGPLESAIAEVVRKYKGPCTIQSFNPMSLKWFYHHLPHIPRGLIAYSFPVEEVPMKATTRFLLKNLLFTPICKPHYIAYEHQDLARHRLRRLHRMRLRGTPVLVWTVRQQEHANLALKRADNIIFEGFIPN